MSTVRALLATSRPLSWINTAYPFAAAYLLSGGGVSVELVVGTLFFLIPYNLAMYGINDVFDVESDLRNPRKGGVEGALVDRSYHRVILWGCVIACLPFLVYLLIVGTVASNAALLVAMFAVVAYSLRGLRFKEVPFLDSITSATHFVAPAVVGALMVEPHLPAVAVRVLAAFFAWCMASHAFGAVQDITADRDAHISSIGTVLGARPTVIVSIGLYLAASILMATVPGIYRWLVVIPLLYVVNIAPFLAITDHDCERANAGWRRFLWLNFIAGAAVTITILAGVTF